MIDAARVARIRGVPPVPETATSTGGHAPRAWRRAGEYVAEIAARADAPEAPITLGGHELVRLRPGEIAILVAGAKRAKTSLALCAAIEHARDRGPAIAVSLELRGRTLVERAIGARCEASWRGVQRGEVSPERMREVLPERLVVIDRDAAKESTIGAAVDELRALYPGEPQLVVVDYVQLMPSNERDARARVDDAMRTLDMLCVRCDVAMLVLSQSSRAASRDLASGERIGLAAADAGAESAAIERWASAVIAIGKIGTDADDGTAAVELSLAAARYEAGDRVIPARVCRRTGRWTITGDARSATDVQAERQKESDEARIATAMDAIRTWILRQKGPVPPSRVREGAKGIHGTIADEARDRLLEAGELVEVQHRVSGMRKGTWCLMARDKAEASKIPLVAPALSRSVPTSDKAPDRADSDTGRCSVPSLSKGQSGRSSETEEQPSELRLEPAGQTARRRRKPRSRP